MKKWIGLSIALVVLLGSYYGMGIGTEKALKKNIDVLNQSNDAVVTLQHYQRGWFRSHAELQWTIKIPQSAAEKMARRTVMVQHKDFTLRIPIEIYHGPIVFTDSGLRLGLGYANAKMPFSAIHHDLQVNYNLQTERPECLVTILVDYFNQTHIQLQVPGFKLTAKQSDTRFRWLGLHADVVVAKNKHDLQGNLDLKGISWFEGGLEGVVGSVQSHYDMRLGRDNLYLGTAQLMMPSLVLIKNQKSLARISDVTLSSNSDVQNGLFNSSLSAHLKQVALGDKIYSGCILELAFQNLDPNILARMNRKLNQAQKAANNRQRIFLSMIPDLPALLSKGAQLKVVNFEINLPEGHVKADLSIALPNQNMTNPLQLIQNIHGDSHLKLAAPVLNHWLQEAVRQKMMVGMQGQALPQVAQQPPVLSTTTQTSPGMPVNSAGVLDAQIAEKVAQKIQEWSNMGVLVQSGSDYTLVFKWTQGKLFINGHPFSPALFAL